MNDLKRVWKESRSDYIERLRSLVAIDTHDLGHGIEGGLEKEGQEYMRRLFVEIGADEIELDHMNEETIIESLKQHNEGNLGHNYDDRYNVYALFKGESDKTLMFNGHIDTMPPGDLSKWASHPHKPEIRDGKMYGLGVCDMKGGLLASTLAVKLLKDTGIKLPVNVMIASVCDEEGGGNGSILAAMNGKKADGVVVCEPTGDELIIAHMGFVFFEVKVEGRANHSGAKWKGVSAIDKAIKLIKGIDELEHEWLLKYKHPLLPAPNLNVGVISGGVAGSTVAPDCSFKLCVHYLPEIMSYEQVVEEFERRINVISDGDEFLREHRPEINVYQAGGGFEMDEDTPLVDCFKKSYEIATKRELNIVGSPAGCDSRVWKNIAKCPTIQFGPGNLEQCHAIDEWLEMDKYMDAILIYANLIMEFAK